jgi:hypothetical protein
MPAAAPARFAFSAAPAWGFQHHAQASAAASIAQVAASASEQSSQVRGYSDDSDSAAEPAMNQKRSASPLDNDNEALAKRRASNRMHAQNTRLRKKAYIQQLEQEVATYRKQLAASRDHEVATQHSAQSRLQGVAPASEALLCSSAINTQQNQTQAATSDDTQQAERHLDTQWAVLNCFFKWLCSSASCSEQQWSTFADQNCVLCLPVGVVQDTAAAREAAQQCCTLVRFTGAADILGSGRQHFLQVANAAHAAAAVAAATVISATADATGTAAADTMPDVRLQVVVERREMYTRCSDSVNSSPDSSTSYVGAPFMCKNSTTQGDGVIGVAMCTFVTDATSSVQRLSSVQLIYDTYAMQTVLAAAAAAAAAVGTTAREATLRCETKDDAVSRIHRRYR